MADEIRKAMWKDKKSEILFHPLTSFSEDVRFAGEFAGQPGSKLKGVIIRKAIPVEKSFRSSPVRSGDSRKTDYLGTIGFRKKGYTLHI